MTTLLRWTDTAGRAAARDAFLERFLAAGNALRPEADRHSSAGEAYTRQVVDLLRPGEFDLFLAQIDGRLAGRAAVSASSVEPGVAVLGLYEAAPGASGDGATERMVAAAVDWAGHRDRTELFAPVDGNTWMAYRFRLHDRDGTGRRHPWEPTHPADYLPRFRDLGFAEALRYQTLGLVFPDHGPYRLRDARDQTAPAAEAAVAGGYRYQRLREVRGAVPFRDLHRLCCDAFRGNPLYEPLPLDAFRALYAGALTDAAADYTGWLRGPGGSLAAVVFAFRQQSAVVVKSVAVDPVHRGRHLSTALIHQMLVEAVRNGLDEVISALVREGNTSEFLSRRHVMPGVETWSHEYAVLRRELSS